MTGDRRRRTAVVRLPAGLPSPVYFVTLMLELPLLPAAS